MTRFKTIDQGKYWEVHDWERGFCVATAIPDQDMAEAMAEALNGSLTVDRDRWKALAVEAGESISALKKEFERLRENAPNLRDVVYLDGVLTVIDVKTELAIKKLQEAGE